MTNRDMLDDISNDGDIKCNYCIYKYDDNNCTGGCADFTWLNAMIDDEGNTPTDNVMLLIAKANRLEKVEYLMDKISKLYDKIDDTKENDLKYMFRVLTEILVEYEEL